MHISPNVVPSTKALSEPYPIGNYRNCQQILAKEWAGVLSRYALRHPVSLDEEASDISDIFYALHHAAQDVGEEEVAEPYHS